MPVRTCEKNTGPPSSRLMSQAMIGNSHPVASSNTGRSGDVERPLDDLVPALERDLGQVDHRQAVEVLDAGAQHVVLQQVRNHLDLDQQLAGPPHQLHRPVVGGQRQGDDHLVDATLR